MTYDAIDNFSLALQAMYGMVREIIKERQETPPPPHQRAFIDTLLEHPDMYPESTLLSEVLIYIVGGFHTSGYSKPSHFYPTVLNHILP